MTFYTQAELLEEKFWDMFKLHKSPILKGAYGAFRGLTKGGEYLARTLAPELTQPIDRFGDWATGLKDAMSQGMDLGFGGNKLMIKDMLAEHGWVMSDRQPIKKGPNIIVFARRAIDTRDDGELIADPKAKAQALLIDKHGNISNGAYLTRAPGKNTAYPTPSKK